MKEKRGGQVVWGGGVDLVSTVMVRMEWDRDEPAFMAVAPTGRAGGREAEEEEEEEERRKKKRKKRKRGRRRKEQKGGGRRREEVGEDRGEAMRRRRERRERRERKRTKEAKEPPISCNRVVLTQDNGQM